MRMQRTIMKMKMCFLYLIKSEKYHTELWDEAVLTANYLRNRIYSTYGTMQEKTSFDAIFRNNHNLSVLRALGARVYVNILNPKQKGKLDDLSIGSWNSCRVQPR